MAVACGVVSFHALAQDRAVVVKAARLFDGRDVRSPGVVVVSGSSIIAVGTTAEVPAGAQVIDLGDATLSPAFHRRAYPSSRGCITPTTAMR